MFFSRREINHSLSTQNSASTLVGFDRTERQPALFSEMPEAAMWIMLSSAKLVGPGDRHSAPSRVPARSMLAPLMNLASGEARNTSACATSSGCPMPKGR